MAGCRVGHPALTFNCPVKLARLQPLCPLKDHMLQKVSHARPLCRLTVSPSPYPNIYNHSGRGHFLMNDPEPVGQLCERNVGSQRRRKRADDLDRDKRFKILARFGNDV